MKTSLIIPIYNRPEYLAQCLDSLRSADLDDVGIVLINDHSSDKRTNDLFNTFHIDGAPIVKIYNSENVGVCRTIKKGLLVAKKLFDSEYYINLDSDAIVKPNFVSKLLALKEQFPDNIITGFNSRTKNKDGSDRHEVIKEERNYVIKKSVGGINFCFDSRQLQQVLNVLIKCWQNGGNWDHQLSIAQLADGNPMICVKPSVIQHIGVRSSMGHNHDAPDTAEDFDDLEKFDLPNVTLFILDTKNIEGAKHAVRQSTRGINFAEVINLSDIAINSKEDYSKFIIRDLVNYINTDFVLIIQSDGFVLNPEAWTNEFLQYDYIGAKWWFNDGLNVGNGGFSLRSKKLLQLTANDKNIVDTHPEDSVICRTYGNYLKSKGIKFAPENIADKFSIEGFAQRDKKYKGSFGYHGFEIDFSDRKDLQAIVPKKTQPNHRRNGRR